MPRLIPTNPVAAGWLAYTMWRKLPPAHRRLLLTAARTHGPRIAALPRRRPKRTRSADQPPGDAERSAHDAILLALVRGRIALARRGAPRAADIRDPRDRGAGSGRVVEPVSDRAPGPHVLRLLLRPDDLLEPRQAARAWRRLRPETGRAARAGRRRHGRAGPLVVADDVEVHLAAAEHEPADVRRPPPGRVSPTGTSPPARSSSDEAACLRRSRPFGVITISGRAVASSAWRRRRWKN